MSELKLLGTTSGKDCLVHFPNNDKAYFITIPYYTNNFKGSMLIDENETMDLQFFSYESLPDNIPKTHRKMIDSYHKLGKKK